MKPRTAVLAISELKLDKRLYPRIKIGWLTAYQYAQAMRAGSVFPPIMVGEYQGEKYVVDGWHRVEAKKDAEGKIRPGYHQALQQLG